MLKRLFSIFSISLFLTGIFLNSYNFNNFVYADSSDDWRNLSSTQDFANAFRAYCKSRDLTIEGSIADGVTSFTTNTFNILCDTVGIDITALQGEIKYRTDGNAGLQYLFSTTGVSAYNRLFAQFLQDNNLEVGDTATPQNNVLYSGKYFTDSEGFSCYVFICNTNNFSTGSQHGVDWTVGNRIDEVGSPYKFRTNELINLCLNTSNGVYQFTTPLLNTSSYNIYKVRIRSNNLYRLICLGDQTNTIKVVETYGDANYYNCYGYYGIFYNPSTEQYYLGCYCYGYLSDMSTPYSYAMTPVPLNLGNSVQPLNVYVTTNNTVINNNNYEGDTIINNNGDVINNNPVYPDPNPNPTPDPPTIPDSGGWQDFSLPEMPNDWLIYGMERKFPFDIPFNILFGLSLLNHEPEIPQFEGDIDLKVCTWHYDIDLTPFDDIAKILRKFEVLAFIIGLAMITKELIMWG